MCLLNMTDYCKMYKRIHFQTSFSHSVLKWLHLSNNASFAFRCNTDDPLWAYGWLWSMYDAWRYCWICYWFTTCLHLSEVFFVCRGNLSQCYCSIQTCCNSYWLASGAPKSPTIVGEIIFIEVITKPPAVLSFTIKFHPCILYIDIHLYLLTSNAVSSE